MTREDRAVINSENKYEKKRKNRQPCAGERGDVPLRDEREQRDALRYESIALR